MLRNVFVLRWLRASVVGPETIVKLDLCGLAIYRGGDFMRLNRGVKYGLFLACLPLFNVGCASLSPKLNALPSIARHHAESQYQTARTAEQRGQLEKARDMYAALQRQSPNTPEYAHRMGVVCTQLQDHVTAGKYFEHARSLSPTNPSILADMGYSAYLQKDYPRSETFLKESVRLAPREPRAINNLAMAVGFQGRYDESLAIFRQVNPETQAILNVAYIQTQRGEVESAVASYQQVLSREPGNKVASNALQQLSPSRAQSATVASTGAIRTEGKGGVTAQQAWELESKPNPVSQDSVSLPSPVIASVEELPSPTDIPNSPVITPGDFNWGPTATTPKTAADLPTGNVKFELPVRSEPPAEIEFESPGESVAEKAVETPSVPPAPASVPELPGSPEVKNELVDVFEGGENAAEPTMPDAQELTGLDWAKEGLAKQRADTESGTKSPGDVLQGFCPVALRDERRLAKALDQYSTEYQAETYRFSSAEARERFLEHPEWYIPAAGGLDIIEVRRGHNVTLGSLDHAVWFRHKLHMFSSAENLEAFRAAPRDFVGK